MATPVEAGMDSLNYYIITNTGLLYAGIRVLTEGCRHCKTVITVQNGCVDGIGFEEHESTCGYDIR